MKNRKLRAFAMFLSTAVVLSLTVPALAGDTEVSSVSAYAEQEEVPETEPETDPGEDPGGEDAADAEALQAVPVEPAAETYTVSLRQTDGGRIVFREEPEELQEKNFTEEETVALRAIPDEGFRTDKVAVRYENGTETAAEYSAGEDIWTFVLGSCNAQAEALFAEEEHEQETADDVQDGQTGEEADEKTADTGGPEKQIPEFPAPDVTEDEDTAPENAEKEAETEPEEDKEEEEMPAEPAASNRLLVKTEDTGFLDPDAVIGVIGDVYLLQFESEEEAGKALAEYEDKAEFAAEDIPVRTASYGEFPVSGEEIPMMTETENPFTEAGQTAPVSAVGRTIALIDTGVSAGQQVSGVYSVLGDDGRDGNGHGSAMLDTIRSFDSDAEVISIKALDNAGVGTVSSLYAAIRMAIDMHAAVINLSVSAYSTEGNEAVSAIIREAAAGGITVVGAAGNNGTDAGAYIPAGIPEAVIAGACNNHGEKLPSSNFGSTVDLLVLAGSSSYAAATLSGIISAEGGIPAPDGIAVFAPVGQTAASDYVDGLCYDNVSGNFQAAGVSYTVHNAGGNRLTDLIPGLTYDSLKAWLGSHEEDDYYLGTPYPEQIVGGVPQYILGRNGDCDNRNPNGDCADIHGNDDYAGKAMMNCTGFVWHALWKASGLSYSEGISRIPAWGGIGAGSWKSFIQNNGLEYMTVKSGGTNEINDMLSTAMWSAKGPDGKLFLEKGDIIWFWVDQIPLGADDLPVNGYYGGLSDKAHVGIYWPATDENDNRWWDSLGICEYQGESGYYLRNMLHQFTPKTGSVAMTIIKLGRNEEKRPGRVNVQKSSAGSIVTDGNPLYSYAGARYAVYGSKADADAGTNAVTEFSTDETGYGESDDVLEAGTTYYIREIESPESYMTDPEIHTAAAAEADQITKSDAVLSPEMPVSDTAGLAIEKVSESGVPASAGRSLAGAQFTVRYYKGAYTALSDLPKPDRTWVLETKDQPDGTCRAFLLPEYKVSGDELYYLPGNTGPVLPLGTITIEETKAPEGYLIGNRFNNGSVEHSGVFLAVIRKTGDGVRLVCENTVIREDGFTAADAPVCGGVKILKLDADMKLDMDGKPYAEGDKTLADAEFTIFSRNEYTVRNKDGSSIAPGGVMQIIRTDENGGAATGSRDLPYGTYEIRETKASAGYKVNTAWSRTFSVQEDGKVTELTGEADICYEPDIKGGVQLQKTDRELGGPEAAGAGSLGGIRYQIINSSAHAVKNRDGKIIGTGEVVQEIITDADGKAEAGAEDLPYGTYTLHETAADPSGHSANDSYLTDGAEDAVFQIREDGKIVSLDKDGEEIVFANQVKRNDISFRKVESGSERPIGSIPFVIENTATGERHVIVTDENGMFSSAKYPHSLNTNANDGLLENYDEGTGVHDPELVYRSGCWFGLGQKGTEAEVKDTLPAFPYGRYTITELRCEANQGYELISGYPFVIEEDISETGGEALTLHNLHNIPGLPEIRTLALDDKTKDHVMAADPEASLTDTVSAKNLAEGKKYVLTATLMDEETGNALRSRGEDGTNNKVTGETAFTASGSEMEIRVPVSLNAEELAGKTLVVFEQLFFIDEDGNRTPVAEHRELGDKDQTIVIPDIHTTFSDAESGSQIGVPEEEQTVSDTVRYTGLIPGKEAAVTAVVMTTDEDGRPTELLDKDGKPFTKTVTFVPEKSEGSVTVEFTIDSSLLAGKKAVCFEEIRYDGVPVAVHADIEDHDQTIWYPSIRTAAKDKTTGDHVAAVSENEIFLDTVAYTGLMPGANYTVRAVLMDAESGEPVRVSGKDVTAEADLTPEKESGKIAVEIPVDTSEIAGMKTVVFEELYLRNAGNAGDNADEEDREERLIAEHKDLADEGQQISVPEIRTSLTGEETGDHSAIYSEKADLTDTVRYKGLLPGKEYRLSAVLMTEDDSGNGTEVLDPEEKPYIAEKVFTAKEPDGEETVTFVVNTALLSGKKIVCFETLYLSDVKLAVHADLQDRDQTVTVPSIHTNAVDAVNGKHVASEGNTVITDTVSYNGLVPGVTYILRGSLMNAETGKAVSSGFLKKVTGETEFTPEEETGTAAVSLSLRTDDLAGVTTVVFEELYRKTDRGKEVLTAQHKDISDTGQQVHVPEVKTSASAGGEKECTAAKNTKLTDEVSYRNLLPGETYVLKGKLIDKKSGRPLSVNSRPVTAKKMFTAASAQGTEEMTFSLDSSLLGGRTLVVFEDLYIRNDEGKEVKIASHADINDAEQSVKIVSSEKEKTPSKTVTPGAGTSSAGTAGVSAPKTGDTSRQGMFALLAAGAAAAGICLLIIKRKTERDI